MLYRITDGTVSVGGETILSHFDFEIKGNEKVAIVGRNGAGKTTLLRVIAGEISLDRDDKREKPGVYEARDFTLGMLSQSPMGTEDKTVDELMEEGCIFSEEFSKERFDYEVEYDRLFTGFGFAKVDKGRLLSSFSGGEQTKIRLIRLLLLKPELLLLDEPTNHLDMKTVEWLEEYLKSYPGACLFVSHDRFFLDQVVDVVYEVEEGKVTRFAGNYTEYRRQKQKQRDIQQKKYESQQAEIKRLEELIERFKHKPKKASFARSRKKLLERMEYIEKPGKEDAHIFTGEIIPNVTGPKWVLTAEHLKIGYDKPLLEMSLKVKRGQKIALIGDNGVGKTTFVRTIAGILPKISGKCTLGNKVEPAYFDQQSAGIESEETVFEHFTERFPGLTQKEARQILSNYLFEGRVTATKVSDLSGGEKARLFLCELLSEKPNFLLLDEPTNHMDIPAKETLESAFASYKGTMLFVSHDRYFVDRVADALLIFENGEAFFYPFGYSHYLERKKKLPGNGESMAALIRAEDEALIADMRAVPKKERHESRPMTTEEAYMEWKLNLLKEPIKRAQEELLILERKREEATTLEEWESLGEQMKTVQSAYTEECLTWYDGYIEIESR